MAEHPGWTIAGEALNKTYSFTEYSAALAFALRVGMAADKRDHHPELHISWGKVAVQWTTHDAGGITALDVEMAKVSDSTYAA